MTALFSWIPGFGVWDSSNRNTADDIEEGRYGLKELVPGVNPQLDIIAIHGLNGHREKTWTADNGVLWLQELLPAEIPHARILTPMIFVAHSLGGIVLKSALIHASLANPTHNDKHQAIKLSTYGIVFLGTPHQGANGVTLAKIAARVISVYEKTNDIVLKHLEQHSEWLNDQMEQYKAISSDFDTKFCFEAYETPIAAGRSILTLAHLISKVVPAWSASVPGATNVDVVEIRKNHRNMVKFRSAEDDDFTTIASYLSIMAKTCVDKIGKRWLSMEAPAQGVKNAVMAWFNLELNNKWLLVYDNYDDPEHFKLERFIPSGSHGKIIITSRRRGCARLGQGLPLNLLERSEAVELLLNSCQKFGKPSESDAVDQAGAYIFSQMISLKEYLPTFKSNVKRVLSKQSQAYGFQDRHDPVFKTFETSFVNIEKSDPVAAKILGLCSFYDSGDVPSDIFSSLTDDQVKLMSTSVDDRLETLYSFSLVKRTESGYIAIHPLESFQTIVKATRIENEHDYSNEQWSLGRKSIPHLAKSSEWIVKFSQSHEELREYSLLWNDCALLHQVHGLYPEAEMFYERALASQVATLGNESLETMRTKLGLAKLYRLVDRNDEAEKLYDDCLRVFTRERGSYALETTQALAGFGNVRWRQSQLPEAKSLLERSIRGYKAILGSTHPETLVATEALGYVYKDLGEYGRATKLIQEALDHNTENLGPEHPGTVRNVQSLALCLIKLDRLDEAARLQQRVLEIGERQLGSLHPTILRALHNMAYIHFLQGKHADAQPLCELAITGREKILGKENLETYGSVELLGAIYFRRGELEDAQNILRRAVKGLRSQSSGMGSGVLSLFRALDWMAQVCEARGDDAQARICYEEALEGHLQALGPMHPTAKKNLQRLQELLERVGDVSEMEKVGRRFDNV
ncbi:hypothetical protein SLS56_002174 [Neofusicoccum ribis]|uniref:TPR-like protein n=1 Tax=Neofusicoccum ribis TaxID=45134 RepID=A0ABR3T5K2_9PEZI